MDVFVLIAFTRIKNGWVMWFTLNVVFKGVGRGEGGRGCGLSSELKAVDKRKTIWKYSLKTLQKLGCIIQS